MATSGSRASGSQRPDGQGSPPRLASSVTGTAEPRQGWVPLTSPQQRDGLHVELLCGHCGVLLMLDGHRYDDHLWVGAEVLCHLCGSVNPVPQALVFERN